jgi:hypothetical protein
MNAHAGRKMEYSAESRSAREGTDIPVLGDQERVNVQPMTKEAESLLFIDPELVRRKESGSMRL